VSIVNTATIGKQRRRPSPQAENCQFANMTNGATFGGDLQKTKAGPGTINAFAGPMRTDSTCSTTRHRVRGGTALRPWSPD
jgi:hypothetical protein